MEKIYSDDNVITLSEAMKFLDKDVNVNIRCLNCLADSFIEDLVFTLDAYCACPKCNSTTLMIK